MKIITKLYILLAVTLLVSLLGWWWRGSGLVQLDAAIGVGGARDPAEDILVDLLRSGVEGLLNVISSEGTTFQEQEIVLLSKLGSLLEANLPLVIQVRLVADEHHDGMGVGVATGIRQPRGDMGEGGAATNIVYQESTSSSAVVPTCNRPESLLTCRVPNLQFYHLPVNIHDHRSELYADGVREVLLKALLGESLHEAGLSDTHITDDDVLEDVLVAHIVLFNDDPLSSPVF